MSALSEDELSQWFISPAGVRGEAKDGPELQNVARTRDAREAQIQTAQTQLDVAGVDFFALSPEDSANLSPGPAVTSDGDEEEDSEEEETGSETNSSEATEAANLVSWALGCVFGRWDARRANHSCDWSKIDPLAAWPIYPPGMLVAAEGGPARESPADYPLRVDWDGVLVDDPGHADDVVVRVRSVFEAIWPGRGDDVERRVFAALGVKDPREYFRSPKGFFEQHIRKYSKNRRKAPIYWLLQSARRSYALWIYYQRLDRDTVFKALRNYVEPKIKGEAVRLKELKERLEQGREMLARRERSKLEKDIDRQDALLGELGAFKEALERVAALGYEPDLDDGVVLNIAPFHELTPWRDAKAYWKALLDGEYPWSTIGKRLRARDTDASPGRSADHG